MKIFTHKYVIYENGWVFEWRLKGDEDSFFVVDGRDIVIWALILVMIYG